MAPDLTSQQSLVFFKHTHTSHMPFLSALILSDAVTGTEWIMISDTNKQYTIGRSSRCDFTLNFYLTDASISAVHAMIQYDRDGGHWKITDMGSKLGTMVTKRIEGYRRSLIHGEFERLDDGDTLQLGGTRQGRAFAVQCLVWRLRHLHNSVRAVRRIPQVEDPSNLYSQNPDFSPQHFAGPSEVVGSRLSWINRDEISISPIRVADSLPEPRIDLTAETPSSLGFSDQEADEGLGYASEKAEKLLRRLSTITDDCPHDKSSVSSRTSLNTSTRDRHSVRDSTVSAHLRSTVHDDDNGFDREDRFGWGDENHDPAGRDGVATDPDHSSVSLWLGRAPPRQ